MNKQDYEQKKLECWLDAANFCGFSARDDIKHSTFDAAFDRAYALGKQKSEEVVGEDIYDIFREKVLNNEFLAIPGKPSVIDRYLEWSKVFKWTVNVLGKKSGISELSNAEETVISGWAARDANNSLYLYEKRPVRDHDEWIEETVIYLDDDLLPDVTWESDPEPVEIIIKRKKK